MGRAYPVSEVLPDKEGREVGHQQYDESVKVHQLLRDCHAHRCWSERASTLTNDLEAGQVPKNLDGERMVQFGPSVMPEEIMEWRFCACEDQES